MDPITLISLATTIGKATGLTTWLGTKLGGAAGAEVAEKVVGIAQAVTGAKTPEEITAAIKADSAAAVQLRIKLLEQSQAFEEMAYADMANARAMQVAALNQTDVFSKRFVYFFAAFWSVVAVIYIGCITFMIIPTSNIRFADTILGFILGTVVATIIQFFYGSSRSSQQKDNTLSELVKRS